MDTKIALIGIMVYDPECVKRTNDLLHEYADYIVGRMGLPLSLIHICICKGKDRVRKLLQHQQPLHAADACLKGQPFLKQQRFVHCNAIFF